MEEKELRDMAVKIENVDSRCRSNEHRLDELDEGFNKMQETQIALVKLATGVEKIGDQLIDMKNDIKDIKTDQKGLTQEVNDLKNKPAQETFSEYKTLKSKVIWIIVGGVVLFILGSVCPGIPW